LPPYNLQELNISQNLIGTDGAKIIAKAINANSLLQTLNISYCGISDDGVLQK